MPNQSEKVVDNGDNTFSKVVSAVPGGASAPAATSTTTSVTGAAASTLLKAANANRKGLIIANDSTAILYVLLGTGAASATNYTFSIPAKATTAADRTITGFTGAVQGFWPAANGFASVSELV
jgi:hypothetical protein